MGSGVTNDPASTISQHGAPTIFVIRTTGGLSRTHTDTRAPVRPLRLSSGNNTPLNSRWTTRPRWSITKLLFLLRGWWAFPSPTPVVIRQKSTTKREVFTSMRFFSIARARDMVVSTNSRMSMMLFPEDSSEAKLFVREFLQTQQHPLLCHVPVRNETRFTPINPTQVFRAPASQVPPFSFLNPTPLPCTRPSIIHYPRRHRENTSTEQRHRSCPVVRPCFV